MGEHERDAKLSDAGEHLGDGRGAEVMALIDVDVHRGSLFPPESGEVQVRKKERPEE